MRKLEEDQAFAERAIEALSEEVRDLGRRVSELTAKLARLEAKLAAGSDLVEGSDEE